MESKCHASNFDEHLPVLILNWVFTHHDKTRFSLNLNGVAVLSPSDDEYGVRHIVSWLLNTVAQPTQKQLEHLNQHWDRIRAWYRIYYELFETIRTSQNTFPRVTSEELSVMKGLLTDLEDMTIVLNTTSRKLMMYNKCQDAWHLLV